MSRRPPTFRSGQGFMGGVREGGAELPPERAEQPPHCFWLPFQSRETSDLSGIHFFPKTSGAPKRANARRSRNPCSGQDDDVPVLGEDHSAQGRSSEERRTVGFSRSFDAGLLDAEATASLGHL